MKSKVRYMKNMILLEEYVIKHPELKTFVSVFKAIVAANKSITTISVGTYFDNDTFSPLLTSRIEKPRIFFSSSNNIPCILVQNNFQTLAMLPLNSISKINVFSQTSGRRTDYKMHFHCYGVDYMISVVLF